MWEQHLAYAAQYSTKQILEYLAFKSESNLDVEIGRQYLIHYAAENGNIEILQYLLEKGVSVNLQDGHGRTALSHATKYYLRISSKGIEAVKYLISKGADINIKDSITGSSPIDYLINRNDEKEIILHNIFFKTQTSQEESYDTNLVNPKEEESENLLPKSSLIETLDQSSERVAEGQDMDSSNLSGI